jgi:hypothetical protein
VCISIDDHASVEMREREAGVLDCIEQQRLAASYVA